MVANQLAAAVLSFDPERSRAACEQWASLPEDAQRELLTFADASGLSLYLWRMAQTQNISARIIHAEEYRARRAKNEIRLEARRSTAAQLCQLFSGAGLPAALLKGFFMAPDYVPDATDRLQNDLDFLLSPADARTAFELLRSRGYWPVSEDADGPALHLPILLPTDFVTPAGDTFNPATQAAIELHERLWSSEFERIPIAFDPPPLSRIVVRDGLPALHPLDQLASVTLHVMRHVFHGNLRIAHLYELAGFLQKHADDDAFWHSWIDEVNEPLRKLCTAGFALAAHDFQCCWPPALQAELNAMPEAVRSWIARHGSSVLPAGSRDKSQLFLQLAFVHGWQNRLVVIQRRLAPVHLPDEARRPGGTRFLLRRAWFHVTTFFKLLPELWKK